MSIIPHTYHLISLGCAKNLVDSWSIDHLLSEEDFKPVENAHQAEFIIVNTCGFIHDARVESKETLREAARKKRPGQKLIAAGCLSQRYQNSLLEEIHGIDALMGTRNMADILSLCKGLSQRQAATQPKLPVYDRIQNLSGLPGFAIQGASTYLKIADGCRRACAFCAIPMIKGPLVSRPIDDIIRDAQVLQAQGIQEINLIAQDVTDYGQDMGFQDGLVHLLDRLLPAIPQIPWLRLLYTFPGYISDALIDLMAQSEQLLPYLDIPLQHADPAVLRSMHRPADMDSVRQTITKMRKRIPKLAIRTTFIVGFPSETEASFNMLKDFIQEIGFDHLGVFTYSPEENTPAEKLGDPLSQSIKESRREELMALQEQISLAKNQNLIGSTLPVLIEGVDPDNHILVGRSYRDAPEVDGLVIIEGEGAVGDMLPVTITAAMPHDLYGRLASKTEKQPR